MWWTIKNINFVRIRISGCQLTDLYHVKISLIDLYGSYCLLKAEKEL